jgi:hypothetical protein
MVLLAAWIFGEVRWRERWHQRLARLEARLDQYILMTTHSDLEARERGVGNTTGLPRAGADIVEAALANAPDLFARARAEQAVLDAAQAAEMEARAGDGHQLGASGQCVRCGRFPIVGDGGLCPGFTSSGDPPTDPPNAALREAGGAA